MDYIFKQRIITIRNISPYLTMQEIQKENLKDYVIHRLIKDGSTFHIYISHADGDFAVKKLEKDLKALPMRFSSVHMKLHSNILCVTGITPSLNEEILQQVLQGFGDVVLPFKLIKSKRTNESKGYGWLVFKDIKSAEKCMWMIPKLELQSRPLHAGWAGNNVTCEDDLLSVSTIYVEGLPGTITTVKDLRQFLSKNDEISFCQFLANDDPSSHSNFAVVEFKNSEAAEQCVLENNGANATNGTLQLTYAIPGYSGVDFVWNKPANIHFKRSQPNTRSLQHSNQCGGLVRSSLQRCNPVGYVRPMVNMQITPGYQTTMGQIPSHYVPMSDMIRPQLVGVRPFVYTPTGLHSIQHHASHHVNQHFQPSYQYQQPSRDQQHQIQQMQYQQHSVNYQQQTSLQHNQLLPQQPPNQQQQSVVEIQQQTPAENHAGSLPQHQEVKVQQEQTTHQVSLQQSQQNQLNEQSHEMGLSQEQQQEQLQQFVAAQESNPLESKQEQLSTVKQQQQQQHTIIQGMEIMEQTKQSQLKEPEQGEKQTQAKLSDQEVYNQTEKSPQLNLDCFQHRQNIVQQSNCVSLTSQQAAETQEQEQICSATEDQLTTVNEKHQNNGGVQYGNNENNKEMKGCRPAEQNINSKEINPAIHILNNTKREDLKQVVSLKQDGELAAQKTSTDIKQLKKQKQDQLQDERMQLQQQQSLKKVDNKDLRPKKDNHERKLLLPPKEKLIILQQKLIEQADALERLSESETKNKLEVKQKSENKEHEKTLKKTSSVVVKNSPTDSKTPEKTPIQSDSLVGKKREGSKTSLPSKNIPGSLKLTEKEEKTKSDPRSSPSRIRLAQRMDIHDDSEIKEKRPRLETDVFPSHDYTVNTLSTNTRYNTPSNVVDLNTTKTKFLGIHKNNENNSKLRNLEEQVVSIASAVETKPTKDQKCKSTNKTIELFHSSDEELRMNQLNRKDDAAQMQTTTAKDLHDKIHSWCNESDGAKGIPGKTIPLVNESDKVKTQELPQRKYQEINCQLLDKDNSNDTNNEKLNVRSSAMPNAKVYERRKLPKLPVGQEKQKSFSVVMDSKAVNVLSNVKMSERNYKIELAPTYNQTGIMRPISKLPFQSISTGVVSEFSSMSIPPQFSHPPSQVNNMQQFQTFANNQFQPIARAETGINPGRKHVNFVPTGVFNHHQILPPMPTAHLLAQNDTFTTNTHYDPVMVPSPLLIGVPGMTGHTSHHMARPIPHIPGPPQHWHGHHQAMSLPPMMQQLPIQNRMTHFPAVYPPVLPNIGVNRNAPEFYLKIPERLPKIQPDTAFHLPYNNLTNMQMKFATRNMNDEASIHMPSFRCEANPSAQLRNDFSSERPATNISSQDMHCYTAANSTNTSGSDEIPTMHSSCAQVNDSKPYNPSKSVDKVTLHDHLVLDLVSEQETSNKDENKIDTKPNKNKTKLHGDKQTFKPNGNFKQSVKVPTFNRTVRELINVPFTSDESRLVYLLKKRHQGHPIAQEWLFIYNGLLTSHFRKLWDPPCKDEKFHFEEVKAECVCNREPDTLKCYGCSKQFFGRVRYHCEMHPYREYLTDLTFCPYCGIDLVWTEKPC